jgi:hypothetical protein
VFVCVLLTALGYLCLYVVPFVLKASWLFSQPVNKKLYYYYYYYYVSSFMQGIHTYIPETNHVSSVYSVAAIPCVLLMVHIALSSILNSFVLLH